MELDQRWLPVESRTDLGNYVGLNVPGASLTPGGLEIRGGGPRDTATEVDGFRLGPLLLPLGALAGADTYTAGYGPELADVPGGAIVTRTRTPSNELRLAADAHHEARIPEANVGSATASGPLVRDRLFGLVSLIGMRRTVPPVGDADGILGPTPPATSEALIGALKLRWRPHARHSVESLTMLAGERAENGAPPGVEGEAQPRVTAQALFTAVTWRGALTDHLSLRSQLGFLTGSADLESMLCRQDPENCQHIPPKIFRRPRTIYSANGPLLAAWRNHGWEVVNGAELRGQPTSWLTHQARLTSRLMFKNAVMSESIPGGYLDEYLLGVPERRTTQLAGGPAWVRVEAASMRTVHSFEERLELWQRLSITPGMALVTARVETPEGSVLQDLAVTPHLGVAWDATGDQRTWLRASLHRRVGTHFEGAAVLAAGSAARRTCRWDPNTHDFSRDCAVSGGPTGRTFGLPCGPANISPDGTNCAVAPRMPATWELTFGAGREIFRALTVDLDVVHRRMSGLPSVQETNRVWNSTGSDVFPSGYRSGRAQSIDDWSTASSLGRRYLSATASVQKRAGAIRALAAYSWSRLDVDLSGSSTAAPPEAAASPGLAEGTFHGVRVLAAADVLGLASVGLIYAFDKGALSQTTVTGDRRIPGAGYRARVGVRPGSNPNDPSDERVIREPDGLHRLNVQVRARVRRFLPVDVDFYLDVINALDFGAVFPDPNGSDFAPVYRRQEPRWFRMGAEFRY